MVMSVTRTLFTPDFSSKWQFLSDDGKILVVDGERRLRNIVSGKQGGAESD
jgi:hypothetical protein